MGHTHFTRRPGSDTLPFVIRHVCSRRPALAGRSPAATLMSDGRPARAREECPEPARTAGAGRLPEPVPAAVAR